MHKNPHLLVHPTTRHFGGPHDFHAGGPSRGRSAFDNIFATTLRVLRNSSLLVSTYVERKKRTEIISRDPITETENGFMEPKWPMRFGGACTPQSSSDQVIGSLGYVSCILQHETCRGTWNLSKTFKCAFHYGTIWMFPKIVVPPNHPFQ